MRTKTTARPDRKGSAPAPGAVPRALAQNPGAPKAGREARPATHGAGVIPKPKAPAQLWQLRLYVVGQTSPALTAFANLKKFCETYLKGRYRITVIDLLEQPQLAKGAQILAIPTVVRRLPKPVRTLIGTLSDTERMLVGLDLRGRST